MSRAALAMVMLLGCSGQLEGTPAVDPVDDWSFVSEAEDVAFSTASGMRFTTVLVNPIVHDGQLYLNVFTILPLGDDALDAILAGENLRMRANGTVYELSVTHLTEPRDIDPILTTALRASGIEATGARWDPQPERYPGTQISQWFFRLVSAAPSAS